MTTTEKQTQRRGIWATISAAFRHGWWLALLVIILVAAISFAQYTLGPHIYRAQQSFHVLVLPVATATSYDNYQAAVWEETIGHALDQQSLTTVPGGFADAINSRLATNTTAASPHNLSQSQFKQNLAWSNYGNALVLTAYWTTPAGATALLDATINALITGDLANLTVGRGPLPANFTAHIATDQPASTPELDPGKQIAAQQNMVTHIELSIVAGVLLLFGWEWLRQMRQVRQMRRAKQ